ncbi:MAG: peptide-methionine (S)-S-oxide reductase MsrA [Rhizobiales bacterium]|nr:peptide-methionine (S)-S-oxide reductase MsrA [Hyphomicrobiales bacterium]NRB14451.1 peptide-methionine (S)-S-oxide reductase MsrA [Hyphomicrobiales bacterium]
MKVILINRAAILLSAIMLSIIIFGASQAAAKTAKVVFAGGCFWCMEGPFDKLNGVTDTISGYTAGKASTATYNQVSSGRTDHIEAVEVTYNPDVISYETLLKTFWVNVDPFDARGQFCDKGHHYTAAIFPKDSAQRNAALASKQAMQKLLGKVFVTKVTDYVSFFPAEDYHQNYYLTNPIRYAYYRAGCRRDRRLQAVWGDLASH